MKTVTKRLKPTEEVPQPAKEQTIPLNPSPFLPPEIMHEILSKVTHSTTLQSCCLATPLMSSLLQHRKNTFLFESILPFIYGSGIYGVDDKDLLKLRLVCKTWKKSIDIFIEDHPSKSAYSSDYHLSQLTLVPSNIGLFNYFLDPYTICRNSFQVNLSPDDRSLRRFVEEYNNVPPGTNPFIGRSLVLKLNMDVEVFDYELIFPYLDHISRFIEHFGLHLYYLTIKIPHNSLLAYYTYRYVYELFLQFLPNLRSLSIYTVRLPTFLTDDLQRRLGPEDFRNLNILHPLAQLESISIVNGGPQPEGITRLLVENFSLKLTRLEVTTWDEEFEKNLPSLRELTLTRLNCNQSLERVGHLEAAKLEKLSLQFRWKRVSVKVLHAVLLRFRESLKYLEMDWCGNEVEAQGKALLLRGRVPKGDEEMMVAVHTLKVSHGLGLDYSFLRWFPMLENLYIREKVVGTEDLLQGPTGRMKKIWERVVKNEEKEGGVQVHTFLWDGAKLYETNVFQVCQKLKLIKIYRYRMDVVDGVTTFVEGAETYWEKLGM